MDPILKDIITSSPRSYVKYIPSIVEKLLIRGYSGNKYGEMVQGNLPVKDSSIVDFFLIPFEEYKNLEPNNFKIFLKAIREINSPLSWVGNKKLLSRLKHDGNDGTMKRCVSTPELEEGKFTVSGDHAG
ncbi:uncharacterized protein CDAR_265161 [Caerostris darwini]|uniref:Uncharacterized protein n=1 Tax=Caerostris darwini TaxID=1538125 RepID=A0AAV4W316_9ARAC|nr:uncharacterized protein CDAR_265161 [Caerostris darwini]